MKNKFSIPHIPGACCGLILMLGSLPASPDARAESKTTLPDRSGKVAAPVPPREIVTAKSVFVDAPGTGRDPFFPGSVRRAPKMVAQTNAVADPQNLPLTLKLIMVGQNKKLAHINNRSFEPGEQAEVTVGSQKIKVRCLEIREKSVLLTIEGTPAPREIFLRPH